jgi:hypothetical protein
MRIRAGLTALAVGGALLTPLGMTGTAAASSHASTACWTAPSGDTFNYDTDAKRAFPRADIVRWCATSASTISLSTRVAHFTNPATDQAWRGFTAALWVVKVGETEYYVAADRDKARVANAAKQTLCNATFSPVGGEYGISFPASCIGSPSSFSVAAAMVYDTDSAVANSTVYADETELRGPVSGRFTAVADHRARHGFLGAETRPGVLPTVNGVGRWGEYAGGVIYWHPTTGAREVHGGILGKWRALGSETGRLGFPTTDELPTSDGRGRLNHFQNGSIYWTPQTGAQSINGAIRQTWVNVQAERGPLRYPTTDELPTPDGRGRFNHFQAGSIYWSPSTGAHAIYGAIRANWASLGWERSALGYPITSERGTADGRGRYNHFQTGSIYWTSATGAREIRGAIRHQWASLGWERSRLGYPTSNEFAVSGGRAHDFQGGRITWNARTGATTVTYR